MMTTGSKKGGKGWRGMGVRRRPDVPVLGHAFNSQHSSNSINNFFKYM